MTRPLIGYAGMTHLGICSSSAAAAAGFEVVCFDPDGELCERLARRELPIVEPDLDDLVAEHAARLSYTAKAEDLEACDVVYVSVDVPTDDEAHSDLAPIEAMLARVDPVLPADATLVVLSQIPPGFSRAHPRSRGELYCQVETLIFGRGVERARHPERFIVGCADPARELPAPWRAFLEAFGCPILPMRYESAELAKISINLCLVASISVANTLAELCENIGADWSEIAPALKLDARIGPAAYLTPGLGIAGGNLERDLRSVVQMAERTGADAGVVRAQIANSAHRRDWPLRVLRREVLDRIESPSIAVLGLAYKPDTASTKNSPSFALLRQIPDVEVAVHDPVVPASAAPHPRARAAADPLDACRDADALVIMTAWPEYAALDPAAIARALRGNVVIDPWALLDPGLLAASSLARYALGSQGGSRYHDSGIKVQ